METISEVEKHEIMEITTSWQRQGRLEGLRLDLASGLRALFGDHAHSLIERLQEYDLEALQSLERRFVPGARLEDLSQPQ